jgi:hypothetical protein
MALGFVTATQNPSLASTYAPAESDKGGWDAGLRNDNHFGMSVRDEHDYRGDDHRHSERRRDDDDYGMRWRSIDTRNLLSQSSATPNVIEAQLVTSLLDGTTLDGAARAGKDGVYPAGDVPSEGIRFDAEESTAPVSATPLPAALPLFAGGMGVLGFLTRRRRSSVTRSRRA